MKMPLAAAHESLVGTKLTLSSPVMNVCCSGKTGH